MTGPANGYEATHFTLVEGQGEWSALYYDGVLFPDKSTAGHGVYGDHDVVIERLLHLLGVELRQSPCLVDPEATRQTHNRGVAVSLTELTNREVAREELLEEAAAKRSAAERLATEAAELERRAR